MNAALITSPNGRGVCYLSPSVSSTPNMHKPNPTQAYRGTQEKQNQHRSFLKRMHTFRVPHIHHCQYNHTASTWREYSLHMAYFSIQGTASTWREYHLHMAYSSIPTHRLHMARVQPPHGVLCYPQKCRQSTSITTSNHISQIMNKSA